MSATDMREAALRFYAEPTHWSVDGTFLPASPDCDRRPDVGATARAALASDGVTMPRVLTDEMRRLIWRAQAEHVSGRNGIAAPDSLVAAMVEDRVNDPKQRAVDEAAWRALTAFAARAPARAVDQAESRPADAAVAALRESAMRATAVIAFVALGYVEGMLDTAAGDAGSIEELARAVKVTIGEAREMVANGAGVSVAEAVAEAAQMMAEAEEEG